MKSSYKSFLRYGLLGVWMIFTASLAGWWYIFGVQQTSRIVALEHAASPAMTRHLKMLAWEGGTFFVCLLAGGAALAYFMFQEVRQKRRLQVFFSTFTHELKTPIASLRLQAESLKEDLAGSSHGRLVDRLIADTQRLTIQLENSLYLANEGANELLLEKIALAPMIDSLREHWPNIELEATSNCFVRADARALECIFTNLIQNAVLHGKATRVQFLPATQGKDLVCIRVRDNGTGYHDDVRQLARLFGRLYAGSGNGIGLYLVKRLTHSMGGNVDFIPGDRFEVAISLPGDVA